MLGGRASISVIFRIPEGEIAKEFMRYDLRNWRRDVCH
jgi:hypothetical protein